MQRNSTFGLFHLCALLLCASVFVQAQTVTGSITGTVRDGSGALIPSATVKLTQTATVRRARVMQFALKLQF